MSDAATNVACQDPTCVADGDDVWISYGRTQDSYDAPVERLTRVNVAHWTLGQTVGAKTVLKALYLEPGVLPDEKLVADVALAMRDFMAFHHATELRIEKSSLT